MIPDIVSKIADYAVTFLSNLGAAAEEILVFIPIILLAFLAFSIFNYKEELAFNRLSSSRIGDIDQLDSKRYYLFMKAFLGWMGFEDDDAPFSEKTKGSNVDTVDEATDEAVKSDGEANIEAAPDVAGVNGANGNRANGSKTGVGGASGNNVSVFDENGFRKYRKVIVFGDPLILIKDGVRYGVLLEKKEHGVGLLAFNKLEKAIGEYGCQEGLIINNGAFSVEDIEESKARNIELQDREWLIKNLLNIQGVEDTAGKDFAFYFQGFWRWALRGY